jgi:hypothetical protein
MDSLLSTLAQSYPKIRFTKGETFCWSPNSGRIFYDNRISDQPSATWSLLHEVGHALLRHKNFTHDFELLSYEIAAWQEAKRLARLFDIAIDQTHVENCLDSYRDWLYQRSICQTCGTQALQMDNEPSYRCHNCYNTWHVPLSHGCRTYRPQQC